MRTSSTDLYYRKFLTRKNLDGSPRATARWQLNPKLDKCKKIPKT